MKYEITDKREYTTIHWTVETKDDTYYIVCQENDLDYEWDVRSEEEGELDRYSEIAKELIDLCNSDNSKPSDY
jgi:hypothetical protein